jgi:large subunit ribosomal protein L17
MRHLKKTIKLGRKAEHRNLLLANQVCSLIEYNRIKTTLAKAKAVRPYAEKMITLGKRGDLHARRMALAFLRQRDAVRKLFADLAPRTAARQGGYCRIVKLGPRQSDSALMAYLEFVDQPSPEQKTEPKAKAKAAPEKK